MELVEKKLGLKQTEGGPVGWVSLIIAYISKQLLHVAPRPLPLPLPPPSNHTILYTSSHLIPSYPYSVATILSPSNLLAADDPASRPPPITLPEGALPLPSPSASSSSRPSFLHPPPALLSPGLASTSSSGFQLELDSSASRTVCSDCGASAASAVVEEDSNVDVDDDALSSDGGDHFDYDDNQQPVIPLTPFRNKVGGHSLMWKFKNRAICKVRPPPTVALPPCDPAAD